MTRRRTEWAAAARRGLCAWGSVALAARAAAAAEAKDPLAAEIGRWSAFLRDSTASDENWKQIKETSAPALALTEQALRAGRRLLALQRLTAVRENLAAAAYISERSADERTDPAQFESEWTRMGTLLRDGLTASAGAAWEGVRPAAVRALGEAALPKLRVYYEASLEYGRNTMPEAGLFYIGAARAQQELASFLRSLPETPAQAAPPLRDLDGELEALDGEILAAYRPPASIDKHREFIVAGALLKEARELNQAGLRYGALLRYLQADLRSLPLRREPTDRDAASVGKGLRELKARLFAGGVDHSLGRVFLEDAEAELAGAAAGTPVANAAAIVASVLPRYFAALAPARPAPARPAPPTLTVTLVRWPYT
jgi:hypothetical protein